MPHTMSAELTSEFEEYDHFTSDEFKSSTGNDHIEVKFPYNETTWASVPD